MGGAIARTDAKEKDAEFDVARNVEEVVVTKGADNREEECRGQYENVIRN